jgi:hypothetical protein
MKEYLIIGLGIIAILFVIWLVLKLCNKFRNKVYKLFIEAETYLKKGEKMEYCVTEIHNLIPYPFNAIITPKIIQFILQKMFNEVKDFLNDGKFNNK